MDFNRNIMRSVDSMNENETRSLYEIEAELESKKDEMQVLQAMGSSSSCQSGWKKHQQARNLRHSLECLEKDLNDTKAESENLYSYLWNLENIFRCYNKVP